MGEKILLKKIRTFVAAAPGNYSRLSLALGYSSPNTIRAWIDKDRIPANKISEIERFFSQKDK
jgi:hypothetical protein